jgi:succinate dehydrogenase hydrophobic anchor subunit
MRDGSSRWFVKVLTAVAVVLITSGVAGAQVNTASGAVE